MQLQNQYEIENEKWDTLVDENPMDIIKQSPNRKKRLTKIFTGVFITLFLVCLLLIIILVISKYKVNKNVIDWNSHNLPKYATPLHYNITIDIDPDSKIFSGEMVIDLVMTNKTNLIVLNCDKNLISSASIRLMDSFITGKRDQEKRAFFKADTIEYTVVQGNSFVLFLFNHILKFSEKVPIYLQLKLIFNGYIRKDMMGLYYSTYTQDSKKEIVVSTQFEPLGARLMIPCIISFFFCLFFSLIFFFLS